MAKERNVGREIALSLLAACVFGAGLTAYLLHSIERPTPPRLVGAAGPASAETPTPPGLANARRVIESFAAALAARRFADAYALMAEPYRTRASLAEFERSCTESPMLAGAQRAAVVGTRRTLLGTTTTLPYSEQARGVLVTSAGSIELTATLLVDRGNTSILALALGGIPVLDGVSAPSPRNRR